MLNPRPIPRWRGATHQTLARLGLGMLVATLPVGMTQIASAQVQSDAPLIPRPGSVSPPQAEIIPSPPSPAPPGGDLNAPNNVPNLPGVPEARVIELAPAAVLPPVKPASPIVNPTVIPLQTRTPPPGMAEGGMRVINLQPDSTGLVPSKPPGPVVPRPATEVAKDLDSLIQDVKGPEAEFNVPVGQTKLIETRRPLTRIAIANTSIADVELLSDQPNSRLLNIHGRMFGHTNITLWDSDDKPISFLVRVSMDTQDLGNRITQLFPGADIHVRQVGSQILLEGEAPDNKVVADIIQLIRTEMQLGEGMRGLGMGMMGGGGMMGSAGGQGSMNGPSGGDGGGGGGASPMGGSMGGGMGMGMGGGGGGMGMSGGVAIINRIRVPGPRQILLRVKIAELNRNALRTLGTSWFRAKDNSLMGSTIGNVANFEDVDGAGSVLTGLVSKALDPAGSFVTASGRAVNSSSQLFGIFDSGRFSMFLDALKSNSMAKILAEPNLMTLDGQPAQFLAGGQFPYPVAQSSSMPGGTGVVTVELKQFGTILTFLPNILANDVIRLDVEPVFSRLNFAQGTTINGGVSPAIDERRARTVVELREGQTLAIAGLLQTTSNGTTLRIPLLGDLPVVGPLFSKNKIEEVESELIVLVTPELVAPMELHEVPEAPGDRVIQPNDFEFYVLGRIEGKSGKDFRATVRQQDPLNVMRHFQSEKQWVVGPHGHSD